MTATLVVMTVAMDDRDSERCGFGQFAAWAQKMRTCHNGHISKAAKIKDSP